MAKRNEKLFHKFDFSTTTSKILEGVHEAIEKYWEQENQIQLRAINNFFDFRDELLIRNQDFFTSQIKVKGHFPVVIRLSKKFVQNFLDITLKSNFNDFNLKNLTQLEFKILNEFCEFVYKKIQDNLVSAKNLRKTKEAVKNINLLFYLQTKNEQCSMMTISIPEDRFNVKELNLIQNFKDEDFVTISTAVKIRAGKAKITLDELKNLSEDDIVILDKSNSAKLTLISGELEKKFNVKVNPSLIMKIDEDEEEFDSDEVIMEKNLWDDIQIEISAEFDKVKMTIGELKQITQGQVVDLGSVFNNEISLYVEEKKVAKGELLVINDKYAVKISEVLNKNANQPQQVKLPESHPRTQQAQPKKEVEPRPVQSAQSAPKPQPQAQPQPKPQAQPQIDEEEFDYSDFEK